MLHLQGAHIIQPSWIRVTSVVYVVIVKYLEQDLCVCRDGCSNTVPVCCGEESYVQRSDLPVGLS